MPEEENTTYELTLLISSELSEFDVNKTLDKVRSSIKAKGGITLKDYSWGKKKLAYYINKAETGYYHTLIITLPGDVITELVREWELSLEIVRHLLISLKKENIEAEALFTPEKEEAVLSSTVVQRMTSTEPKKPAPATPTKPSQATDKQPDVKTPKTPPVDDKTRQKDLDTKLDQLLKTDLE